jgi:hypothetical protein
MCLTLTDCSPGGRRSQPRGTAHARGAVLALIADHTHRDPSLPAGLSGGLLSLCRRNQASQISAVPAAVIRTMSRGSTSTE